MEAERNLQIVPDEFEEANPKPISKTREKALTKKSQATSQDGRQARATRTRLAIIDALLDLIVEGDISPTARQIAVRAGVSERSVFQHFVDLEELHKALSERQLSRILAMSEDISPNLPLTERIDAYVKQRSRILEALTPVRRAALAIEMHSAELRRSRDLFHALSLEEVNKVFANEIKNYKRSDRSIYASSIEVVSSWNAWESLRVQGHSSDSAEAVMRFSLKALLHISSGNESN
ncbi:MAG: TetR/AcrR family transcriptional regulator [Acidimicrobiales bacterium]|nr:TetR/AcrR family transcriptional regulator [Acidimicrobiales bacterium]